MKRRIAGSTGLRVSRLGLGTLTWGRSVNRPAARELLRTFVEAGGNLIDTAAAYGSGSTEEMIGEIIMRDLSRDDLVIATKSGFVHEGGQRVMDTSRSTMLRELDESLRRLRTDHVDLWQVHAWGEAPLEETLAAFDLAVSQGKARYVGLSNFVGWQTAQAATWQKADPNRTPIATAQIEYSLLARRSEIEVIPAARALGLGVLPWSPLGRGVLTGKYRTGTPRDSRGADEHLEWFIEPYLETRSRAVVESVVRAAEGLDLTPAQVALLWIRDAPGVTAPLVGPRTADQLRELLAVEDRELPGEIVDALDDVSGGPNPGR
ncbi:MAG: aldo/keto reductase [Propionibacterium sp.]|nr:aldo/keto reductase [Propionibacterium sp.]